MFPSVSIFRILLLLTLSTGALILGAMSLTTHAQDSLSSHTEAAPRQDFLVNFRNPPLCFYEGRSEQTEKPENTRDWIYSLLLGDCHPQQPTLQKLIIDALLPTSAGSLSAQVEPNPVQYAQASPPVDAAFKDQEMP